MNLLEATDRLTQENFSFCKWDCERNFKGLVGPLKCIYAAQVET